MKFRKKYLIGISFAFVVLVIDLLFFMGKNSVSGGRFFYTLLIVALNLAWIQFWIDFIKLNKKNKELEQKFLEFVRAISTNVQSGLTIPKAIIQASSKDYGALTPYIKKLSSQVEWGITVQKAFLNFSKETKNKVIKRSVYIVIEAEKSGGDISSIMDSVTESVLYVKKMKAQRKASMFSQVIQGYIIYVVFLAIMITLQLIVFPKLTGAATQPLAGATTATQTEAFINTDNLFFGIAMIQGFFTGLVIGSFSEGTIKEGIIHSLILIMVGALVISLANPSAFPLNPEIGLLELFR